MSDGDRARFERYVARLSDDETLILHRVVCRRAAAIYEPMYRGKRKRHHRAAMASVSLLRARARA